jgi:hypothetical protein
MLVEGFLAEVVEEGIKEDYQEIFTAKISAWMEN